MSEHAQNLTQRTRGRDITAASSAAQWSPAFLPGAQLLGLGLGPGQHRQTGIGGHTQTDVNRELGELCQVRVTFKFLLSLSLHHIQSELISEW